jgi:hypothetical protein
METVLPDVKQFPKYVNLALLFIVIWMHFMEVIATYLHSLAVAAGINCTLLCLFKKNIFGTLYTLAKYFTKKQQKLTWLTKTGVDFIKVGRRA